MYSEHHNNIIMHMQLWTELNDVTQGVLPNDITDDWQALATKVQRKAELELEASIGRKKLKEIMMLHKEEESLYTGDVCKCYQIS